MKNILWIAGLVGLMGQSEAGISKKNTGNGIEMIIKRVRDYSRITSGTKGKNFSDFWTKFSTNFYEPTFLIGWYRLYGIVYTV